MDVAPALFGSALGFTAGFAAGALWRSRRGEGDWIITFVVVVVTAVWASSFLIDAYSKEYDPPSSIYPIMAAVVGLLGAQRLKGGGNGS